MHLLRVVTAGLFVVAAVTPANAQLRTDLQRIAAQAGGHVGVACSLPGRTLDCNLNENDKFPMQSVYKLPIAMAALHEIDLGHLKVDQNVRFLASDLISPGQHSPLRDRHPGAGIDVSVQELLRLAVSESDGVASDMLVRTLGGPKVVNAYVKSLGITGIAIEDTEKTLGRDSRAQYRNYAQPAAMVNLLRILADRPPFSPNSTRLLFRWLTESPTGENRLKAFLPKGTVVAHKTGTSGQDNGITHATNDVGLITMPNGQKLAIAVFVMDSPASEVVREKVIAEIGKAIWDEAQTAR